MYQAKRTEWDTDAVLDVKAWLADNQTGPASPHVSVSQPVQLGSWTKASSTAGGGYNFGSGSGLLPFQMPRLPVDLNAGREQYVAKASSDKGDVETVVQAAASAGAALSDCDVLTFRNNLNKIFGTPFDPRSSWAVDACWRGAGWPLFLDIVQLEQPWRGDPAELQKFTYWGYAFEAACTGRAVADSSSEYGVLVSTRIGTLRTLLGAEVDCYDPAACAGVCSMAPPGLDAYIELKTYGLPQRQQQQFNLHKHKHPKWWLQSFLAGVPTLALGGRDAQGIVHRIDLVKTSELPRISAASGAGWDAQLALRFGEHCLGWMQRVAAGHPGEHVRFSYDGDSRAVRYAVLESGDLPARLQKVLAGS